MLPVTLVLVVYFVTTRESGELDSLLMRGRGVFFAELFGVYQGLMLVINNSIQRVICETYSLKVLHLLQDPDHSTIAQIFWQNPGALLDYV